MTEPFPLPLVLIPVDGVGATGNPLYRLGAEFRWRNITVPEGFKTDLVSAPGWSGVSITRYKKAAVIHDYLCNKIRAGQMARMSIAQADGCLYEAMRDCGASVVLATAYWLYVSTRHRIVG